MREPHLSGVVRITHFFCADVIMTGKLYTSYDAINGYPTVVEYYSVCGKLGYDSLTHEHSVF